MKVFVVQDGWYDSGTIDSVWLDKERALARAAELRAHKDYDYREKGQPNWEVIGVYTDEPDAAEHES